VGSERISHVARPRGRSGDASRKRILDAAEQEFATKGFDGARLAAIAAGADVPQALIHHHFADKAGLYREVLEGALAAITAIGWHILQTMGPPTRPTKGAREGRAEGQSTFRWAELVLLVEALAAMLVDFHATNARVVHILRHEAMRGGPLARELLRRHVKPQLDEVVALFDHLRDEGQVRADVDARHLCISAIAMASFPYTEDAFLEAVWSLDPLSPDFVAQRKREIVRTVLGRIAP
jgi:TetR/AcrR family transcriptional regulator